VRTKRAIGFLTTCLLLKYGYTYFPYSALEAVIEQSKGGCYLALRKTQGTLQAETPDWQPRIIFFESITASEKTIRSQTGKEKLLMATLPELSFTILEHLKSRGRITIGEIVTFTNANRNTVKKHLENLVQIITSNRTVQARVPGIQ